MDYKLRRRTRLGWTAIGLLALGLSVGAPRGASAQLDVVLLHDLTGSTGGLTPNWCANIATKFIAPIQQAHPGSHFALASHLDFPFSPHGAPGEYAYRVEEPMTPTPTAPGSLVDKLCALTNGNGGDSPESQYVALTLALTGQGVDLDGNGLFTDPGDVAPSSLNYTGNQIVVYHFTFPPVFHDRDTDPNYPFSGSAPVPGRTATLAAVAANPVIYIGLITGTLFAGFVDPQTGQSLQSPQSLGVPADPMQELAQATGGAVLDVGTDLSGLEAAVLESLETIGGEPPVVPGLSLPAGVIGACLLIVLSLLVSKRRIG